MPQLGHTLRVTRFRPQKTSCVKSFRFAAQPSTLPDLQQQAFKG